MTKEGKRRMLRALMREHHKTSVEIAKLLDVEPQTVRSWRAGLAEMGTSTFRLLEFLLAAR